MKGLRIDFEEDFILEDSSTSDLSVDEIMASFHGSFADESQILVAASSNVRYVNPYREKNDWGLFSHQQTMKRQRADRKGFKWGTLIIVVLATVGILLILESVDDGTAFSAWGIG